MLTGIPRLGLQRRIMLLVGAGLAVMFSVGGIVGLSAVEDTAEQVFRERLATAHATAAVVERDLERLAADVTLLAGHLPASGASSPGDVATAILSAVGDGGRYPFFSVVGITVQDRAGKTVASAGTEAIGMNTSASAIPGANAGVRIVRDAGSIGDAPVFVDVIVPLDEVGAPEIAHVIARTAAEDRAIAFDPGAPAAGPPPSTAGRASGPSVDRYNLEILAADGTTVLSIGEGSPAGSVSAHLPAIAAALQAREAAALVDDEGGEPHVMAGVPVDGTPLYLVLEQPVDVALALPNELRERFLLLVGVGFVAALIVAWYTTRRVVKPTEQLTIAASRMAEGDLSRPIDVAAYDEVATLATTLELMRRRLLEAQTELVDLNRELEQRIQQRTARLGFVLRKTISAQEDERHALARELHDETAQTVAALSIALDRAREEAAARSDGGLERISEAKLIAGRLLDEIRRLIVGLRPSVLDDLGLGPAISWYAETVMAERDRVTEVQVDVPSSRLPSHLEVALFRIAQEALNNIAKHAQALSASIVVRRSGDVVDVRISDDGVGFDVAEGVKRARASGGVGLAGMQERVALLGGTIDISSHVGSGTEIVATVPVASEDGL